MSDQPSSYLKISVITPSYNQDNFIRQTIESVLGQGYPNLEYIVMDGGSTDSTVDILKSYGDAITWRSEKDSGQSEAINKGMKLASGDVLAYLNSDDLYADGCLFRVNEYFQKNPDMNWVYGQCHIINERNREIRKFVTAYKDFWMKRYSYDKLLSINYINQPATFWRKRIRDEFGLFNEQEHLVMDYEFWLRIGKRYPAGFLNKPLALFRSYGNSKSVQQTKKQFQDELRIAKKYSTRSMPIMLHYLNYFSILAGYNILRFLTVKE